MNTFVVRTGADVPFAYLLKLANMVSSHIYGLDDFQKLSGDVMRLINASNWRNVNVQKKFLLRFEIFKMNVEIFSRC